MIKYGVESDFKEVVSKAEILAQAVPWIRSLAGRFVVVKVGGEILLDEQRAQQFAQDIVLLHSVGIKVLVVHGGGPQISSLSNKLGVTPHFVEGQRVTDEATLEVTAMVLLGDVNRKLVSLVNRATNVAFGVSGIDAGILLVAPASGPLGLVGDVELVRCEPILRLIDGGFIPVLASLGVDRAGQVYNVNADLAAGQIAAAIGAEKFVVLTNVAGLYESYPDRGSLISEIDCSSLRVLLGSGKLEGGMIPKIRAILAAIEGGVNRAHILDGRIKHALLLEFFTREGIGTMIYP